MKRFCKFLIMFSFALLFIFFTKNNAKASELSSETIDSNIETVDIISSTDESVSTTSTNYVDNVAIVYRTLGTDSELVTVGIKISYYYNDGVWVEIKNVALSFYSVSGFSGTSYSTSTYGGGSNTQDYCIRKFSITNTDTNVTIYYNLYVYVDTYGEINYYAVRI